MSLDPTRIPVLVGAGEVTEKDDDRLREPADLAADAVERALADTGAPGAVRERVDRLEVVNVTAWPYDDLPGLLAERLGVDAGRRFHTPWGGDQPTLRVDRVSAAIAAGERQVAVICGAEAYRSLELSLREGGFPAWTPPRHAEPLDPATLNNAVSVAHGVHMPPESYPLFENAGRVHRGESLADAQRWSAEVWAEMSQVAAGNPAAWNRQTRTAEEILEVGPKNRLICFPYPKWMNALMSVNQAVAVVVCDLATARELGIAEDALVFPVAGAGARDTPAVERPQGALDAVGTFVRPHYHRSPAMEAALDGTLAGAGGAIDAVDLVELYSCFPCVPRMAAAHLGIEDRRRFTVTGGLTFFGGPANDYMLHAVAAMMRALRRGEGETGLLYGQGGILTKHHALVVGRRPPEAGYPTDGERSDAERQRAVERANPMVDFDVRPEGPATVETSSVRYGRDLEPHFGYVVGRLEATGARFLARVDDPGTIEGLLADDSGIGGRGKVVTGEDGLGRFSG